MKRFEAIAIRGEEQEQDEHDARIVRTLLFLTDSAADVHCRAESFADAGEHVSAYATLEAFVAAVSRVLKPDVEPAIYRCGHRSVVPVSDAALRSHILRCDCPACRTSAEACAAIAKAEG